MKDNKLRFLIHFKPRGTPECFPMDTVVIYAYSRRHARQRFLDTFGSSYIYVTIELLSENCNTDLIAI